MDDTIVSYKVDNYYNKESETGINFDDYFPYLDLDIIKKDIIISDKDKDLPLWNEISNKVNF